MNKGALVRLVCTETGIDSAQVGRIDLHARHSFFEIDERVAPQILKKIETGTYEGKTFNVSISNDKDYKSQPPSRKKKKY